LLPLLLSLALFAPHYDSRGITPALVDDLVRRYGAKETVHKLTERDPADTSMFGDYEGVLDGVASGDPRWLALVPKLAPGTDAGTAESLRIAVARALPKNAAGVLSLISHDQSWRDACSYPMIEPTPKETHAYFSAAVPAVRAVMSPRLHRARALCLAELSKASS
jgi:hypothetical protein